MNGAKALVKTLHAGGLNTYFANPGTSEMHLVTALAEEGLRAVLCLFEGVATGAADGYGRMSGKPAATLLHLGPGYANGGANLHNAVKARTPVVNIVGEHATHHRAFDTPLSSDIRGWAAPNSRWIGTAESADEVGPLAAQALAASFGPPGACATLIVPADCAWTETEVLGELVAPPFAVEVDQDRVSAVATAMIAAARPVILLGANALQEDALAAAAALTRSRKLDRPLRIMSETFPARQARGRGRLAPDRVPYFAEHACADLEGVDLLVLVGAREPIAFFAYPGRPSRLAADDCLIVTLADPGEDCADALRAIGRCLGAEPAPAPPPSSSPAGPTGALTPGAVGTSLARHMPDQSIVSDDGVTSSLPIFLKTTGAAPHDWLALTGGAIGQGLPVAVGAAVACPDRKVVALSGDGAAMYTVQALWTLVRENLDVTVLIFANDSYAILEIELARTGAVVETNAPQPLLKLDNPQIQWSKLSESLGLRCSECFAADKFDVAFSEAMGRKGPEVIIIRLQA